VCVDGERWWRLQNWSTAASTRAALVDKLADASALKHDVDRRGRALSDQLRSCLTADELADFTRLVADKTRVRLQRHDVDDWLRLADRLLGELSAVDVDAEHERDLISHC